MFKIPCNVVAVDGVVVVVTVMLGCPFGRLFVSRSRLFSQACVCELVRLEGCPHV